MYTFMYCYEFFKKLCYKIEMPKRDVKSLLKPILELHPSLIPRVT